jgi:hypothetical protein
MQEATLFTRYAPRVKRAGVDSNLTRVTVRAFAPMNGRQPIVNVTAMATSMTKTANDQTHTFATFFMREIVPSPTIVRISLGRMIHRFFV